DRKPRPFDNTAKNNKQICERPRDNVVYCVEFRSKNYERLNYNNKDKMERKTDSNMMKKKLIKINRQLAKALINTSLSINLISMKYVKKRRHTWKYLKKESTIGLVGVEVIGYISSINVVVCSISINQPFYIIQKLASDIVLGMPW
ncbi:1636_t:CDS:2, partial [Racocetra persica]